MKSELTKEKRGDVLMKSDPLIKSCTFCTHFDVCKLFDLIVHRYTPYSRTDREVVIKVLGEKCVHFKKS